MSSLVTTLAWRYVRGRRSVLLNGTARAALLSTSIGVTTMVVAMALMTGYSEDLQRKLIGGNAGIVAYALDRTPDHRRAARPARGAPRRRLGGGGGLRPGLDLDARRSASARHHAARRGSQEDGRRGAVRRPARRTPACRPSCSGASSSAASASAEGDLLRLVAVDVEDLELPVPQGAQRKVVRDRLRRGRRRLGDGRSRAGRGSSAAARACSRSWSRTRSRPRRCRSRCRRSSAMSSWSPTGGSSTASCSPRCACRRWRCSSSSA